LSDCWGNVLPNSYGVTQTSAQWALAMGNSIMNEWIGMAPLVRAQLMEGMATREAAEKISCHKVGHAYTALDRLCSGVGHWDDPWGI